MHNYPFFMCVIDRDAHSQKKIYYRKWKKMKNVFKKAAAAVMAFTLLGAGTTITKSLSKTDNILVASAACQYHHGTVVQGRYIDNARLDTSNYFYYKDNGQWYKKTARVCRCCGGFVGWYTQKASYFESRPPLISGEVFCCTESRQ